VSTLARVVIVIVVDALKTMRAPLNLAACPLGPDPGQVAEGNGVVGGGAHDARLPKWGLIEGT